MCACLMAVLRIAIAADRVAWIVASCAMMIVEIVARMLRLESEDVQTLVGKIGIIFHVLGTAFVIKISAAMICAMARFLHISKGMPMGENIHQILNVNNKMLMKTSNLLTSAL